MALDIIMGIMQNFILIMHHISSDFIHQYILHLFIFNAQVSHRYSRTRMIETLAEYFEANAIDRSLNVSPCLTQ